MAQTNSTKLISELYEMWDGIYSKYQVNHIEGDINKSYLFYQYEDSTTNYNKNLGSSIRKAEAEMLAKDWGLDWNSGYAINTASGVDATDNLIYRSRVQSELSWNILNNGFIENKDRSKVKENESKILELLENENNKGDGLIVKWHKIIYHFNKSKIDILNKRLSLAKQRVDVAYKLNAISLVTQEELLKNLESFAEIKSLLNIYEDYNTKVSEFEKEEINGDFPLLDIDYEYVLKGLKGTKNDSVVALQLANLELQNKPLNDINLRAYSRYNYYDLITTTSNRSFFTFGLSLGVPLVFDKKESQNLIRLKREELESVNPENNIDVQKDVLGYFYEFRYKLKQFNTFYYKRLMMKELLRKEQARHQVNTLDFNPLKALRLLDEMMSIDIELIDLKQQMYLYILRIQAAEPTLEIKRVLKPIHLDDIEIKEAVKIENEVYIWSKTLVEYDHDFLLNYLVLNKVPKVVLSAGGDLITLNKFIDAVHDKGILIDLMIGDNKLINDFNISKLTDKLANVHLEKIQGIHLDVEPHTFDDWKTNKELYLTKYKALLIATKSYCEDNNFKLAISIPTHYPEENIKEMFSIADQVYFMCYENVKSDFIIRKVENYDLSKTVIALRTEDFQDRVEIQIKIKDLKDNLNPKTFVLHDLGRLIKLEE